jgi:hypothetical protein
VAAPLCHLLVPHRPPYYGMGYTLYQLLGGLCSLAWREGVGYHLSRICLRGLRPPTTFVLTAAELWQQSVLQHRGAVNRCWCDGRGGYPPSSGGVYGELMPSGDCPALCGGFWSGDLPSAIRWLATACVDLVGGSRLFHCSKGRRFLGIFVGFGLRLPARRRFRGFGST